MTLRFWQAGATGDYADPALWLPPGAPQPGDTLVITSGNPIVTFTTPDESLDGETIDLGGAGRQPVGPGYAPVIQPGTAGFVSAPDPTLQFNVDGFGQVGNIGASTTITMPASLGLVLPGGRPPGANAGSLVFENNEGIVNNHGTIQTAGEVDLGPVPLLRAGSLWLTYLSPANDGVFQNVPGGVMNVGLGSTMGILAMQVPEPATGAAPPRLGFVNSGVVNVHGTLELSAFMSGEGTFNLDSSFIPGRGIVPGLMLVDQTSPQAGFRAGPGYSAFSETINFDGGHLELNSWFKAAGEDTPNFMIGNFGNSPTDQIRIDNFFVSSDLFSNGALDLFDPSGNETKLVFQGNHTLADFSVTTDAIGTIITANHTVHIPIPIPFPL